MTAKVLVLLSAALLAGAPAVLAQPYGPGPAGDVAGKSMTGMRIGPLASSPSPFHIPNAEVFGDTVEERAFGRAFDDSYLTPEIRNIGRLPDVPIELRATQGRSDLNRVNAGAFARSGPNAIGRSAVGGVDKTPIRNAPRKNLVPGQD